MAKNPMSNAPREFVGMQRVTPERLNPWKDMANFSDEQLEAMHAEYKRDGFERMAGTIAKLLEDRQRRMGNRAA